MFTPVLALMILEKFHRISLTLQTRNSISMVVVTVVGVINLIMLCLPLTKWRAAVVACVGALMLAVAPFSMYLLGDMFVIFPAFDNLKILVIMLLSSAAFAVLLQFFRGRIEAIVENHFKRNPLFKEDEEQNFFEKLKLKKHSRKNDE